MTEPTDTSHRATGQDADTPEYKGPTGGWGSLKGIAHIALGEKPSPAALLTLERQNKPGGFMCTSCAWAKPAKPHALEFCENGAKATLWELTSKRCTPEFFAEHTLSELRGWHDYDLEIEGRLTHPMRYDRDADRYVPVAWEDAFAEIGAELREIDPKAAVFYTSGHASLETSYLYGLFGRLYGHNNLPDSSNMCHETTSVSLKKTIGVAVGTCVLDDFDHCDAIFFFGQNTGSNSPRFLHPLKSAVDRGCRIVTFNPVREKGLISFADPQNPVQMTFGKPTEISEEYLQVRPGGDIAAIMGMAKFVLEADDAGGGVLDTSFIAEHTTGFEAFAAMVRATPWEAIERHSGLDRADLKRAAAIYIGAKNVIGIYGMGLTQHVHGSHNIAMLVNLLLLRGNIGRAGAGISPVRGHSNVQGQRTVGISEKPELVPTDRLAERYGFQPPMDTGTTTVDVGEGVLDGSIKAFISLGGNFARAIPDNARIEPAWSRLRLTVQIATKLNRSHLLPGEVAYLLPCLGRTEEDVQAAGPQAVSMEDSLSHIFGSIGKAPPASDALRAELAIVSGIAKATLDPNPAVRWDEWTGDYGLVRDEIAAIYPDLFGDYNGRLFRPGGFYKGNKARERHWETESGKAEFTTPPSLSALGIDAEGDRLTLITLRSNDQFNTTIYGFRDRLRGVEGDRNVVFINRDEMARLNLSEGQSVTLVSTVEDGEERQVPRLKVTPFDLPAGCVAAYYPEANPLVPLSYHDEMSKTPAYKGAPVRIVI